jgi:hypothetical protein
LISSVINPAKTGEKVFVGPLGSMRSSRGVGEGQGEEEAVVLVSAAASSEALGRRMDKSNDLMTERVTGG